MSDQRMDTTKLQLGEPMSFFLGGLLMRTWVKRSLQEEKCLRDSYTNAYPSMGDNSHIAAFLGPPAPKSCHGDLLFVMNAQP